MTNDTLHRPPAIWLVVMLFGMIPYLSLFANDFTTLSGTLPSLSVTDNSPAPPPAPCTTPSELVYWNLNACNANNSWEASNYNEFMPVYPANGGCNNVNASKIYRTSGLHSCTPGVNNTAGACVGASLSCSFADNASSAVRFEVTVTPNSGSTGSLSSLKFFEKAPTMYSYIGGATGPNDYPTRFGIRVTKNGQEVFKQINIPTKQNWTLETIDFSSDPDFTVISTTTFKFELLAYCRVGNGAGTSVWDLDDIKVYGCCGGSSSPCTNVTCGGEVADNEARCSGFDPMPVREVVPPCYAGGNGSENCFKVDPPRSGSQYGISYNVMYEGGEPMYLSVTGGNIKKVIVKGGPVSAIYTNPPFTNLTAPINPNNGKPYGISHFTICYYSGSSMPALQYQWLSSTTGCPTNPSQAIPGATSATYDPPYISQTTWYVRMVRAVGCTSPNDWVPSNCIIKRVVNINATTSQITCQDNGTSDPYDDKFTFSLHVTGSGSAGWIATIGGQNYSGNYGTSVTVGPLPITSNPLTFEVKDKDLWHCKASMTVTPPPTCSMPPAPGTIGNFVWNDLNQNGKQDPGEPGVDGVKVRLYKCDGTFVAEGLTANGGQYSFMNIPSNIQYYVQFEPLAGDKLTVANIDNNTQDNIDSDADPANGKTTCFLLSPGQTDNSWDAGMYKPLQPKGSIGDFVWKDFNNNGIQDANEPGIPGIKVRLKTCAGAVLQVKETDASGKYLFESLDAGCYVISIDKPAEYAYSPKGPGNATDSDINPGTGMTDQINLAQGQNRTDIDAGLYPLPVPGKIGDFVWEDKNKNGIQDFGEPGIKGIIVILETCSGVYVKETTTNEYGKYLFTDVQPGEYRVKFVTNSTYKDFTIPNVDNNTKDDKDSDADWQGITGCFTITSGEMNMTIDGGFLPPANLPNCDNISIKAGQGSIIIEGLTAPFIMIQVFNHDTWQTVFSCFGNNCTTPTQIIPNLPAGTYLVKISFYKENWWGGFICEKVEKVIVTGGSSLTLACPNNLTHTAPAGQNGMVVNYPPPTATSTCTAGSVTVTTNPQSGSFFQVGTTTVHVTATDGCGNSKTCSFTVTVNPGVTPVLTLTCPANVAMTAPAGQNGMIVNYPAPTATSTCTTGSVTVTTNPQSGSFFQVGTTTVHVTATDGCGNSKNCSFTVIVNPGTPACDNVTNGGMIGYDEASVPCQSFDPQPIQSLSLPTGGSGTIEYIWLKSTTGCPDNLTQAIPGTNSPTYDPGPITQTTWYMRCARRVGCTDWVESNCIKKEVKPCVGCDNVTNGGTIGDDEILCKQPYYPTAIKSITPPSGGSGAIEYIWLSSTTGCPSDLSQIIPGQNGPTYNPGEITQTTWYRRCARRVGCTDWVESNCVKKELCSANPCNISVSAGAGSITFTGINGAKPLIKVFGPMPQWTLKFECTGNCTSGTVVVPNLAPGTYFYDVQLLDANWQPLCSGDSYKKNGYITVGGAGTSNLTIPTAGTGIASSESIEREEILDRITTRQTPDFTLFPNPANGLVTIQWSQAEAERSVDIYLYNQLGQQVKTLQLEDAGLGAETLEINDLRDGQYVVLLRLEGQAPVVKKLIISR